MSYEEQLRRHLADAPPEPPVPACLDPLLRVQEWADHYPEVQVPASFFRQRRSTQQHPQIIAAIINEHAKSSEFRRAKMEELEDRLEDCEIRLTDCAARSNLNRFSSAEDLTVVNGIRQENEYNGVILHSILEDVEQINLEICLLEKFTSTCRESFDLYLHHVSPQALAPFVESVHEVAARVQSDKPGVQKFIERLSKIYESLRSGGLTNDQSETKVGTSFVRKSIKYWVHPDNLTEVKCHVLRHLPIYAFPNKDGSPHNPAITSIYYDNDNLDLYTGRLLKQDEAIALRIRWYGVPSQPVVYIENKIHFEDWTGEPSTKSRFGLEEKRVNAYMAGTYTLDGRIRELKTQGIVPVKEIDAMDKLAKDVQKAVRERELKPMMRTFYNRTAFQLPDSARVRLSLDEDLTYIREDRQIVGRKLVNGTIDSNWRRRDVGIEWPFERLPENEVHHFPYAIMEVKLQTEAGKEPPLWARELMQSQLVEESPKFSKFVHGCVSLLEPLTPLHPYWLPQMHTDIRHRRQNTLLELTRTIVDVPWEIPNNLHITPRPPFWRNSVSSFSPRSSLDGSSSSIAARTVLRRQSIFDAAIENEDSGKIPIAPIKSSGEKQGRRWSMISGVSSGGMSTAATSSTKTSPAGQTLSYLPGKCKKLMVPTVVEPKVHFANERVLLGWTHYALFLLNGATAIIRFTSASTQEMKILRFAGIGITCGAVLFLFVGLFIREQRQKKITWNPDQERLDSVVPLFLILITVTFAVAVNWFAVFAY